MIFNYIDLGSYCFKHLVNAFGVAKNIFFYPGTLFLWLFWPSFNGAPAAGTFVGARAVINTVYSLAASAVASFALSSIVDKRGKLSMVSSCWFVENLNRFLLAQKETRMLSLQVHVQNATLAGGVAAGAVANLKLGPVGAIILGSAAGILSVIGYVYITVRAAYACCTVVATFICYLHAASQKYHKLSTSRSWDLSFTWVYSFLYASRRLLFSFRVH